MFISIDHEKCWNDQGVFSEELADSDFSSRLTLDDNSKDGKKFSYLKYLGDTNFLESRIFLIHALLKDLCVGIVSSDRWAMFYISEYCLAVNKYYPQDKREVIERMIGILNSLEKELGSNDRFVELKSKIVKVFQQK